MASTRGALSSSFLFQKMLRFAVDESYRNQAIFYVKAVIGFLGVAFGARLLWRWIKKMAKTARLTRLRNKKQLERKRAIEKLEQLIKQTEMTSEESDVITALTIEELLDQTKSGQLTATRVLTAYQIKALEVHKKTNCIVEPIFEAQAWAQQLDRSSSRGPLHGLPVSLKDCIGVQGYDMTAGCSKFVNEPSQADSVVTQVLKRQGAIPFVKTNVPQTMLSWETTNPIFGRTVNPHDPKRTAGGSSGGEGALISGGGSLVGIGTDLGGSIRIPAAICGVPGFRPTSARISKKGGLVILGGNNVQSSWGPLSRDVNGLIVVMRALLVPEMYRLDPTIPIMPFRDEVLNDKRPLRVGFSSFDGMFEPVPAMRRAVAEAKSLLEASGHQLVPWEEKALSSVMKLFGPCGFADGCAEIGSILDCDASDDAVGLLKMGSSLPMFLRKLTANILQPFVPDLSNGIRMWCGLENVSQLWDAVKEIKRLRNVVIENWQKNELDAIICPAFGCPAVSHGLPQRLMGPVSYTATFNVLDFPAGCLPITTVTGKDEADMKNYPSMAKATDSYRILKKDMEGSVGLPVAVQVVTLPWQDELCLRIMNELERAVKSHSKGN